MYKYKKYYKADLKKLFNNFSKNSENPILITPAEISNNKDIQKLFATKAKSKKTNHKILVAYYNHLWEPLLNIATFFNLADKNKNQNWLDTQDIQNLLFLSGNEVITTQKRFIFPIKIKYLSDLINKYLAQLPIINSFCLTTWVVARSIPRTNSEYSVSIVVPARNEEGNITKITKSIPKFGKWQEIIFVEGASSDDTWGAINSEVSKKTRKDLKISAYKQRGKGKADAVRLGFSKAKGDILMIYDADRTVEAKDLEKFYEVLALGKAEFANGSRLVYPMEKDAMRTLNKIGNKFFSVLFTWILGQRFKDTLCGTKALFKKDYEKIVKHRKKFGSIDPFGDFDLIFGAIRQNLKVVEIPVRYKERVYGSTNISRFRHGLLLFKMTWEAFKQFKAY